MTDQRIDQRGGWNWVKVQLEVNAPSMKRHASSGIGRRSAWPGIVGSWYSSDDAMVRGDGSALAELFPGFALGSSVGYKPTRREPMSVPTVAFTLGTLQRHRENRRA